MAKQTNYLHIKITDKLKEDFETMCDERGIGMSSAIRDLIANSVRNYKRTGKKASDKEDN